MKDKKQNKPIMPRTVRNDRTLDDMARDLRKAGIDPSKLEERAQMLALARGVQLKTRNAGEKRKRDAEDGDGSMEVDGDMTGASASQWADEDSDEDMDVDGAPGKKRKSVSGRAIAANGKLPKKNRQIAGLSDSAQADKATKLHRLAQRGPNRLAKAGEADRHVPTKMPKHLFSGKRGRGKTSHR